MNSKLIAYKEFVWQNPREVGFAVLMAIFVLLAVYKSTPVMVDKVFELQVSKNKKAIRNVHQKRQVSVTKSVYVDKLMLKSGSKLQHSKLGAVGFDNNFFIDVEGEFEVKEAGDYYLIPGSDDGFALYVNDKLLCEHPGDRPYSTKRCRIKLDAKTHRFKLNYFQGGGHAGLTLAYQKQGDRKRRWFGEDSKYIKF